MTKNQTSTVRRHDGYRIRALPSAWWQILGLVGKHWYLVYTARTKKEGAHYLSIAVEDDSAIMEKYDDFCLLPPELEHTIPAHTRGQHRAWLESNSPATASARAALVRPAASTARTTRGRVSRRRS